MINSGSSRNPVRTNLPVRNFRLRIFNLIRSGLGGNREKGLIRALSIAIKSTGLRLPTTLDFGTGSMLVVSELHSSGVISSYCGLDTYAAEDDAFKESDFYKRYVQLNHLEDVLSFTGYDIAIASDTLHHLDWIEIPRALEYLCSIAKFVIVKDMFEYGQITRQVLRLSDWFGNSPFEVNVPSRYLTPQHWDEILQKLNLVEIKRWQNVRIHNGLFGVILPRRCNFVSLICSKSNHVS